MGRWKALKLVGSGSGWYEIERDSGTGGWFALHWECLCASGWNYYRQISLSPSTPDTYFQVKIELNTSNFDYSKCNSDGSDLRFYQTDGSELDYWIESWNTSSTSIIWVEVKDSNTSTIYMCYGNSGASAASNGDNTFLFFDDFEGSTLNSDKWSIEKRGSDNAIVELDGNGNLHLAGYPNTISSGNAKSTSTFTNGFLIRARRKYSNEYYVDISIGNGTLQDMDDGGTSKWWHTTQGDGYMWMEQTLSEHKIQKTPSGSAYVNLTEDTSNSWGATDTFEIIDFIYDSSGNIKWIHEGVEKLSATNTDYLSSSKYLLLSQGEYSGGQGGDSYYDWVLVRKYDSNEPSASVGSEESC